MDDFSAPSGLIYSEEQAAIWDSIQDRLRACGLYDRRGVTELLIKILRLTYQQGREDESYKIYGPKIDPYIKEDEKG